MHQLRFDMIVFFLPPFVLFEVIDRVLWLSQKLLKTSLQLQERLTLLQVKSDLLSSVFGEEKANDLLKELSGDMRKRDSLHSQLQDRKSRLQVPVQNVLAVCKSVSYMNNLYPAIPGNSFYVFALTRWST